MTVRPNYIVLAPSFSPDNGGAIFLHELVHALRGLGEEAHLWPKHASGIRPLARISAILKRPSLLWKTPRFNTNPRLDTPVAETSDLRENTIVVYPEITLGNPLGARNVVRWLLYKPGLLNPYRFGKDEMFFRAGEMSDIPEITGGAPDLFLWRINPVYRNENRSDRNGACYIVRKGREKDRIPETADAIQIDGMSHEQISEIFNKCKRFYSYDEATFYSQYAAICGCESVVVPGLYSSRSEWVKHHPIGRYGVAYGIDDIPHSITTRDQMMNMLLRKEADGLESVKEFVKSSMIRFKK